MGNRLLMAGLLVVTSLLLVPSVNVEANHRYAHQSRCTVWNSLSVPPTTIRVYRVKEGRVDTVNFRLYVQRVTSSEFGKSQPYQLQRAGAVAVKQYAWYHIMHYRGGSFRGRCFDVRDTTHDQIYRVKDNGVPESTASAVNSTWGITVWHGSRFIMTGYRTGHKGRCASDVNGWKLYARTARRCADNGWSGEQILKRYYHGVLK